VSRATAWAWARLTGGLAVLAVVLWRTGIDPFVGGLSSLEPGVLVLGAGLALLATVACAWRWLLVARGLGVELRLWPAVAACYRAQFLNTTLPGGILGDVHRGVRNGRETGSTARGLRAVAWERLAGQVVQAVIAVVVLLLLPSPVRSQVPLTVAVLAVGVVVGGVLLRGLARRPSRTLVDRLLRAAREDVRCALLVRRAWPGIVVASTVAVAVHLTTYLLAARAVGVSASPVTLVPLALLVLLAAGLPLNVAGWGPREGMAAWSFAAAGVGAGQGVAAAVAYGAIVTVASLPGAVVLVVATGRRRSVDPVHRRVPLPAGEKGRTGA
jgi:uncharacterized membrane protein YbhN (UPF0104 family)